MLDPSVVGCSGQQSTFVCQIGKITERTAYFSDMPVALLVVLYI